MSLSSRLVALILVAMLPLLIVHLLNERMLRAEREMDVRNSVLQQALFLSGDLSHRVEGIQQVQSVLVEMEPIRTRDPAGCAALLRRLKAERLLLNNILVAGADGTVWCDALHDPSAVGVFAVADRPYFQQAMATGAFTISGYNIGRSTGKPALHFATAYRDAAGSPVGVVITALDLQMLAERLDRGAWSSDRALLIADRDGTVLVRLPGNDLHRGRPMTPELMPLLQETAPLTIKVTGTMDRLPRIMGVVPPAANGAGLYAGIGLSVEAAYAPIDAAGNRALVLTAVLALLTAALAFAIADRAVRRPVKRLHAAAVRWRRGEHAARSGLTGPSEIGQLGQAFDLLASELQAELVRKDTLLRELAHRTMNNLQVLNSVLTLQKQRTPDEGTRNELDMAAGRVQAMAMAYRSLQASGGAETLDFAQVLEDLCRSLETALLPPGSACTVDAMPLILSADRAMPLALVANELVTNAIKHGGVDGPVHVALRPDAEGWRLVVSNRGRLPADFRPGQTGGFGLLMAVAMLTRVGVRLAYAARNGWVECTATVPIAVLNAQTGAEERTPLRTGTAD